MQMRSPQTPQSLPQRVTQWYPYLRRVRVGCDTVSDTREEEADKDECVQVEQPSLLFIADARGGWN